MPKYKVEAIIRCTDGTEASIPYGMRSSALSAVRSTATILDMAETPTVLHPSGHVIDPPIVRIVVTAVEED